MTFRPIRTAAICALVSVAGMPALADGRETLGWGRLMSNDYFGDGRDRWRTSSYVVSWMHGPDWVGGLPDRIGQVLEYRLRAEIVAPRELRGPRSDDRAYAGMLGVGLHSHWQQGPVEARAGLDVVFTGPQTGLDVLHERFHDRIGQPLPAANVLENQIGDGVHAMLSGEISHPMELAPGIEVRPFAEAQVGVEDLLRVGVDFRVGALGQGAHEVRDVVTGQRYRAITNEEYGWEFVAGADVAHVADSILFPDGFAAAQDTRWRGRAGAHWQGGRDVTFFYGVTWLSEEYVGQPEGQFVGSMKLNFNF